MEDKNTRTESPDEMHFFVDGYIDETDTVTIPREEYDNLIAESTILRVVERVITSKHGYPGDIFNELIVILGIDESDEEEDE